MWILLLIKTKVRVHGLYRHLDIYTKKNTNEWLRINFNFHNMFSLHDTKVQRVDSVDFVFEQYSLYMF